MTIVLILIVAFAALVPLAVVVLLRRWWVAWALAGVGIAAWTGYAIYALDFYECPSHTGECDPGLGVLFLGLLLVFWLGGTAVGVGARVARSRLSAEVPRRPRRG